MELKEELCKNVMTTAGYLTNLNRGTMKTRKIKTKMYEYKYFYFVGTDEYYPTKTTNLMQAEESVTIWLDKTNVSVYSTTDPYQDLETYKKKRP